MISTYFESEELKKIKGLHPLFGKSIDAVLELIGKDPEDGRYDVDGDDAYIMVSTYETKPVNAERRFESHRDYIDIQLLFEGRELLGFAHPGQLTVTDEYRPDYELYGMIEDFDSVMLTPGKLVIIYPEEPHAPGLSWGGQSERVRKMVIKIRI